MAPGDGAARDVPTILEPGDARARARDDREHREHREHRERQEDADDRPRARHSGEIRHYTPLRLLGSGGMGVVFAAHDNKLDRPVALKLLHTHRSSARDRMRLLAEAQALARLTHPNVVTIYEVGELDGQIYLAMEFVPGLTLKAWLKAKPRDWATVVRVFRDAGRGLAAAHAAGLVHRDFKPGNVLVGDDGRVRVLDFGLAFVPDEATEPVMSPAARHPRTAPVPALSDSMSTETGSPALEYVTLGNSISGTPAFMAPEQVLGFRVDARSDVYALSVSLYQALFGERPFRGRTLDERVQELRAPKPITIPRRPRLPAWLRRALSRGLELNPQDRFQTMDDMLRAIDIERHRRRAFAVAGLCGAAVLLAGGYAIAWTQSTRCSGGAALLAGAWDDERRATIASAFAASEQGYAADSWTRLERRLDDYAGAWVGARARACEANARGEQTAELYGLELTCLDQRRRSLAALTRALQRPDEKTISVALSLVGGLPDLARCSDIEALTAAYPPPEDPAVAREVDAQRDRLADIRLARKLGRFDEGLEQVDVVLARARALDYLPLIAQATASRGFLLYAKEGAEDPAPVLNEALWLADTIRDDELLADIMGQLVFALVYSARGEEAARLRPHADAVMARLGPDTIGSAHLLSAFGAGHLVAGERDEGLAVLQGVLERLREITGPDSADVANALNNVGLAHTYRGPAGYADAIELFTESLSIKEAIYGPEHPEVADSLTNLGNALLHGGGAPEDACAYFERAMDIAASSRGREHPDTVLAYLNLGGCYQITGNNVRALGLTAEGLELAIKVHGDTHPMTLIHQQNLASLRLESGEAEAVLTQLTPLVPPLREADPPRPRDLATILGLIGEAAVAVGDDARATEAYEEAVRLFDATPEPTALDAALVTYKLAEHLGRLQRDPKRRRALATAALEAFRAQPRQESTVADIEAWLERDAHGSSDRPGARR